jgi:phosphatidylglycerophosphate synthase
VFDRQLRSVKELLLKPLSRPPFSWIHPNIYTLIAFGLGIASGFTVLFGHTGPALILWILNRLFDGLDGSVARATNLQSDFGGYLDILTDFAVYAWIPISFVLRPLFVAGFLPDRFTLSAVLALLGLFYLNAAGWMYLSALLEKRNAGAAARGEMTSVSMPAGLVEGFETIVFYTLFFLRPDQVGLLFAGMALLILVGLFQRLWWAAVNLR